MAMKLHLIPFDPIILPPDIMLAMRHPQYFLAADRALLVADSNHQLRAVLLD
jgi:hypothetical protein